MTAPEDALDIVGGRVDKAVEVITRRSSVSPEIGVILGSGQGGFSRRLEGAGYIPYREIPYFFQPMVPGHEGVLSLGELAGRKVIVLEGRIHTYEGYFMREVVFPVRVLQRMGVRSLITCNAAGGLDTSMSVGDVMVVSDHINLMGTNPLVGQIHQGRGCPFISMSGAYDGEYRRLAWEKGRDLGEDLKEGVLAAVNGPCYETPAESRMLRTLGADAITMSSVPGVIMARFLDMRVLGLSLITNVHDPDRVMDHQDVLNVAHSRTGFLMELIAGIIPALDPGGGGESEIPGNG